MSKDILKIIKIYLKKYFMAIVVLLLGTTLFSVVTTSTQLNELKYNVASYEFEKNIGVEKREKVANLKSYEEMEKERGKIDEERSEYVTNYNGKLSRDSFEYLKHRYAVGLYLGEYPLYGNATFYHSNEDVNVVFGEYHEQYKKYLTNYELQNSDKYKQLVTMQPGSQTAINLQNEINKIYPPVVDYGSMKLMSFAKENIGEDKVQIKETLYSANINLGYYALITLIGLLIFGVEYHTNFGKFIASLPFRKERVYYAKLILSLLILFVAFVLVGLVNILVVKASVLGEIYNISTAFFAYSKVFYLGIGLIFLAAIFSSFCGSVLSIGALYIPAVLSYAYLAFPVWKILRYLGQEELLTKVNLYNEKLVPMFYHFKYVEAKYTITWLSILFIITLLTVNIYKKHNVEREGMFFTFSGIDKIGYVILLIGLWTFLAILFDDILSISFIVISLIIDVVVAYILWKLARLKIRI